MATSTRRISLVDDDRDQAMRAANAARSATVARASTTTLVNREKQVAPPAQPANLRPTDVNPSSPIRSRLEVGSDDPRKATSTAPDTANDSFVVGPKLTAAQRASVASRTATSPVKGEVLATTPTLATPTGYNEASARAAFQASVADGRAQAAGFYQPGDDPEWAFRQWERAHFANAAGMASPDSPVGSGTAAGQVALHQPGQAYFMTPEQKAKLQWPAPTPATDPARAQAAAAAAQQAQALINQRTTAAQNLAAGGTGSPATPVGDLFSIESNLRGQQFTPNFTPTFDQERAEMIRSATLTPQDIAATDITRARAAADRATQMRDQLAQLASREVAAGSYAPSAEATRARALTASGLENLSNTPDRMEIAREALRLFDEEQGIGATDAIRQIRDAAAATGRTKSGVTTTRLGDLGVILGQDRNRFERGVLNDYAAEVMNDRLARLQAAQSVAGQFRGEDIADEQLRAGLREEQRGELSRRGSMLGGVADLDRALTGTELELAGTVRRDAEADRDYRTGVAQANAGLALNRADALGGIDMERFNRDTSMRNEMRTEREWQDYLAQQGINNRVTQRELEDRLASSELQRRIALAQAQAGLTSDPALIQALINLGVTG